MTTDRLNELKKAGYEGRMQWLGYWRPTHQNEIPTEDEWCHVYRHETDGMIRAHGADRFRIKPSKLPDNV